MRLTDEQLAELEAVLRARSDLSSIVTQAAIGMAVEVRRGREMLRFWKDRARRSDKAAKIWKDHAEQLEREGESGSGAAYVLSTGEVARLANCSPDWVRKLAQRGEIRSLRTGRGQFLFRREDVRAFLVERNGGTVDGT